ncbi:MAG: CopG family transcriptional regulator [Stigonema ocellatum SAG 48.90 = DSM 106950]|nr:CopG family transcriptional regulator [Stigonema ocellatum SAG 48.90 = DSM 106950]
MQINARLDEEYTNKIAYIQQQTNQGVTDVIKSAIDLYYQQLQQNSLDPLLALTESGFVGCAEADPNLSVNYKSVLKDALKAKYGNR